MKNVKLLAAAGMLSLVSFASFAHPVSVTADTLDSAEAVRQLPLQPFAYLDSSAVIWTWLPVYASVM